ncbi:MAG: substrate-binding domain-containing protein [Gammaproteobacteria bacterium]
MSKRISCGALLITMLINATVMAADKESEFIVVQSTTSTQNSGLLDYLLPKFTARSGIEVRVVAVGTGQAIKNARNGDGDVLLVHAKKSEEAFVAEGFGVARHDLMYNDFVIVGPREDVAGINSAGSATQALRKIAQSTAAFVSRGDDSGTHKKELSLWRGTDIDLSAASGTWYRESGSGMGATLNMASGMNAYTLTDRATWISFKNKGELQILFAGDEALFNQYGIILVNPERHPNVKVDAGKRFIGWMLSEEGQAAIGAFKVAEQQLFYPNAKVE